jgi:protein ImuB
MMQKRFVSIWFPALLHDWMIRKDPELLNKPFVLTSMDHGRIVITSSDSKLNSKGVFAGMNLADARVFVAKLEGIDEEKGRAEKILKGLSEWLLRFSPVVSIDGNDGLYIDASGCAHLWGSEKSYLTEIHKRLEAFGYTVRIAMAGNPGAAWAIARFGKNKTIIPNGSETKAVYDFPPQALRIELEWVAQFQKLGLRKLGDFIGFDYYAIRRRFGEGVCKRIRQIKGTEEEYIQPIIPVEPYQCRLNCHVPVNGRKAVVIALEKLLQELSSRLIQEGKGIRYAVFECSRIDQKTSFIEIRTAEANADEKHLFKLFEYRFPELETDPGVELFVLTAKQVQSLETRQELFFQDNNGPSMMALNRLFDRMRSKLHKKQISVFDPAEQHWPERAVKFHEGLPGGDKQEWPLDKPRPIRLEKPPILIEVTAPIPDYPPMLFRLNGQLHKVIRADGPERLEQEWWVGEGLHRDYYIIEDDKAVRYWIFRLGHYDPKLKASWYVHGIFA